MEGSAKGKYSIDCHVGLEGEAGNLLYADGGHGVALSVWYKLVSAEAKGEELQSKAQDNAQINLFNLETGLPLEAGWSWTMKETSVNSLRREGETGSRPDNETEYSKKTIYLTYVEDREHDGTLLVGVRVNSSDSDGGGSAIGESKQGVRVHRFPMKIWQWNDFQVSGPQVAHGGNDSDYRWLQDTDYSNLWRAAVYFVTFKDPRKSVSKIEYSFSNYRSIYTIRRRNLYETSGYVWGPLTAGSVSVYPKFADGEKTKTISINTGKGFAVGLVCSANINVSPWDDVDGNNYDTRLTVWDENPTPSTLYLNQWVPYLWTRVLQDKDDDDQTFSSKICTDVDNKLMAKRIDPIGIKNVGYGSMGVAENLLPFQIRLCCYSGSSSHWIQWSVHRYQTDPPVICALQCLNNSQWMRNSGIADNDGDHWAVLDDNPSGVGLFPKWDTDGFCVTIGSDSGLKPLKADVASVATDEGIPVHFVQDSTFYEESTRFVWQFLPWQNQAKQHPDRHHFKILKRKQQDGI